MSVFTSAFPCAGTTTSYALYKSYPAASAEPRVGVMANSVNFLKQKDFGVTASQTLKTIAERAVESTWPILF